MVTATALVSRSWRKKFKPCKTIATARYVCIIWLRADSKSLSSAAHIVIRLRIPCTYLETKWGYFPKDWAAKLHESPKESDKGKPRSVQSNENITTRVQKLTQIHTTAHACMQAVWPVGSQGWSADLNLSLTESKNTPKELFSFKVLQDTGLQCCFIRL